MFFIVWKNILNCYFGFVLCGKGWLFINICKKYVFFLGKFCFFLFWDFLLFFLICKGFDRFFFIVWLEFDDFDLELEWWMCLIFLVVVIICWELLIFLFSLIFFIIILFICMVFILLFWNCVCIVIFILNFLCDSINGGEYNFKEVCKKFVLKM